MQWREVKLPRLTIIFPIICFLHLLIIIVSERYELGVGNVTNDVKLAREIIHQLCISPMAHSELMRGLHDFGQAELVWLFIVSFFFFSMKRLIKKKKKTKILWINSFVFGLLFKGSEEFESILKDVADFK